MASRSEFQFWTGANGSPANTWKTAVNQTLNALVSVQITDTLNNPKAMKLMLNNAAPDPFGSTAGNQVGPFSPGQTDELIEFQNVRLLSPDTGNILFAGKIYRLDEEYNPIYGQTIRIRAFDNLKELVDFPTDDKDVGFTTSNQKRSNIIRRVINDYVNPPHESTLAIPATNLNISGGATILEESVKTIASISSGHAEGDVFINTGKKKALNSILGIASEDPHSSAANEDDFGYDFHASYAFDLATSSGNHIPGQYFNYFKRGSRPATLESNVSNFKGLHLEYPTTVGGYTESGIHRIMLPEYAFDRDGEEIYTEGLINTKETTKSDAGIQEARKHLRMELWEVTLTSASPTFRWKGKAFDNREKADQAASDVAEMLTFASGGTNYPVGRIQYQDNSTQNEPARILVSYEVGSRTQEYLNTYITGSGTKTLTGGSTSNTLTIVPSTGRLNEKYSIRRPYRANRNVQSGGDGLRRTIFNALTKGKEVTIRGNLRMLDIPYTYIDTYVSSETGSGNSSVPTLAIDPALYGFKIGMTIAKIDAVGEVTAYGYATTIAGQAVTARLNTGNWDGYISTTARVRLYIPIRPGHYMYATNQLQHIASYQFINDVMYSEGEAMTVTNFQTQATQAAAPYGVKGLGVKANAISSSIADTTAPIGALTDTLAKAGLPWTLIPANATDRPVESIDSNTIRVNACVLSLGNGLYTYNLGTASTDVTADHTIIYFDPDTSTTALQFAVKTAYTTNTEHIVLGWCKSIPVAVGAKAILHMGPNAIGVDPVVDGAFIRVASVDTAQIANDAITAAVLSPAAQPWTCNIRWRPHTTNGPVRVRWDNGTDNTNATLKFQDGSTVAIVEDNMDTDMNVSTTYYAYIDGLSGNQEMVFSSNYLDAMGTTKILLATITTGASNADGGSPVILPFNSKAPTINAVSIAADSITANAIAANTITADEIFGNTITADQIATDAITTNELLIGAGTNAIGGLVANGDLDLGNIGSGNLSNIADGGGYVKPTGLQVMYADRAGTGLQANGRVQLPIGTGDGAKFFSYGQTSGTIVVLDNLGIKGVSGVSGSFPNFTGGTTQFSLSSVDGKATAGGGKIVLDASGVQVLAATNALSASSGVQFKYGSSLSNAQSQSNYIGLRITQVDSGGLNDNGFTELEWEQTVSDTVAMSFNTMRLLEVGGITGATNATGIWRPPVSGGSAGEFLKISSGDGTIDSPYGTEWAAPTNAIYSLVHTSHANNTYTAGTMLDLNGTTFSHEDTSSASSQNNSGSTFIQDITIDSRGHVTAMGTGTASGSGTITGNTVFTSNRGLYTTGGTEINDTAFYMNSTNVGDAGARAVMYGNTLDVNSTVILSGIGNVTGSGETTLHVSTAFGTVGVIRKGSSSQRYKENIATLVVDSSKVYDLTPKTFKWKDVTETINGATVNTTGVADFGLIAEEVNTVLPELVGLDAEDRPDAVSYQLLSVLLLEEMKVLKTRIIALENA